MEKRIFRSICGAALIVFLCSLVIILGVSYQHFSQEQVQQLKSETGLAARGVEMSGRSYLESLDTGDYRVTWIVKDGTVLYDNQTDASKLGNHKNREEVSEALKSGYGESSRYSDTMSKKLYYEAQRLDDGSVIRLSADQMSVLGMLIKFAFPLVVMIVLAIGLSLFLASRAAAKITGPINSIDPGRPEDYIDNEDYSEIRPLLIRIDRQQKQLKKDRSEIERTAMIRQEFTANVSHELKTPLHAISGYAELLENGMVREQDVKDFTGKIRTESGRLTKLVEDIIDLTRLDSTGNEAVKEQCDLSKIAANAIDSLAPAAESANVHVELKSEPESIVIRGVPQQLYSIIYNLCDNAIKYNHDGGRVDVTLKQGSPSMFPDIIARDRYGEEKFTENDVITQIRVKDTGIGIPEDSQDRVFERFYRVDKSRSKEVGGTGLGLSIVKHAAMIHNARLRVESEPGKGSEFIVTFRQ
ncbi:MAG: sensor histidine kinase [Anaerovoracaceae bacterium]|jgi:two-component system phosphate regulon sensor histidine kinase PhoR